jgi:serine protease
MKKSYIVTTIVLASFLILGISGISFGQKFFVKDGIKALEGPKWVPGEIIVNFKPGISNKVIANINLKHGTSVISTSRFAGFKRLKIPKRKTVTDMVEIYKRNPNVEYAEPNFIAHAFMIPNDPYYEYQWHMRQINMEPAWDLTTGHSSVIVAVVDTGVAYEDYQESGVPIGKSGKFTGGTVFAMASDLYKTNFVPGYDFVNDDEHPNDDEGHGTHVTGTIAQSTDNGIGVAGVAFNTSIMPIKVLDSNGSGTYADIADGIYFAADNGAKIINMSLGGSIGSVTLENALAYAYNQGIIIVCASGNDGSATTVSYPAAYDAYCIAVGATRWDEAVAYYSNGGSSIDLTAPGGDINVDQNSDGYGDGVLQQTFDADPTNFGYWFYQGTSMAAPHVSGVAALLVAYGVATTPDEVREALQATAMDRGAEGWDPEYGWGIVNAYAALNYTAELNSLPEADAGGPYSGIEDETITFDGSGSSDLDDDTLIYIWNFGDGSTGAGISPTHTYTAGGQYMVTLVVNDGKIDSLPSEATVSITEVNDPPVADAGPDQTSLVGESATFDGSGSYDIDDVIASYAWDFGDQTTASGITATHSYSTSGTYTVSLTVTDFSGDTDADTAQVTVTEQSVIVIHVESIVMDLSNRTAGKNKFTKATAKVTIWDSDGNPADGATVYGSWSGATSDNDSGVTDTNGEVMLTSDSVKNPSKGTTFTFTVDDVVKSTRTYESTNNTKTSDSITVP